MSTVLVTRRYRCWNPQELRHLWMHQTILQISGLPLQHMQILSDQLGAFKYKILCNCKHCLSYREVLKAASLTGEPMMNGVTTALTVLTQLGYRMKSSNVMQNNDDSSTTTWTLVKYPKRSDI